MKDKSIQLTSRLNSANFMPMFKRIKEEIKARPEFWFFIPFTIGIVMIAWYIKYFLK